MQMQIQSTMWVQHYCCASNNADANVCANNSTDAVANADNNTDAVADPSSIAVLHSIADGNACTEGDSGAVVDAAASTGEEADIRMVMPAAEKMPTAAMAQVASRAPSQPAEAKAKLQPSNLTCFLAVTAA